MRITLRMTLVMSFALLLAIGVGPRTGRYRTLTVLTGSMRPAIPAGSVVIVTPEPARRVQVGQVITYAIPVGDHRVLSHRVIEVLRGGEHPVVRTKGDANPVSDPWIAAITSPTVWHVRAVIPSLGWVIRWLRMPALRITFVLGTPVALAVLWLVSLWRQPGKTRPRPDGARSRV